MCATCAGIPRDSSAAKQKRRKEAREKGGAHTILACMLACMYACMYRAGAAAAHVQPRVCNATPRESERDKLCAARDCCCALLAGNKREADARVYVRPPPHTAVVTHCIRALLIFSFSFRRERKKDAVATIFFIHARTGKIFHAPGNENLALYLLSRAGVYTTVGGRGGGKN